MIETSSQIASARLRLLSKLEALAGTYLIDKSPFALPERYADKFVHGLPWVALLGLPVQLGTIALTIGAAALPTLGGHASGLSAFASLVTLALSLAALPGLFRHSRRGWSLWSFALLGFAVHALLHFSLFGTAASGVCLWLMFQVRDRYVA